MNLDSDPDPGFWPNLDLDPEPDPDPDLWLCCQYEKKKKILEKNNFLHTVSIFVKNKISTTYFVSILSYFYMCGSGSTKLLNTDPIRIRIIVGDAGFEPGTSATEV